jgi:hypothetical protein
MLSRSCSAASRSNCQSHEVFNIDRSNIADNQCRDSSDFFEARLEIDLLSCKLSWNKYFGRRYRTQSGSDQLATAILTISYSRLGCAESSKKLDTTCISYNVMAVSETPCHCGASKKTKASSNWTWGWLLRGTTNRGAICESPLRHPTLEVLDLSSAIGCYTLRRRQSLRYHEHSWICGEGLTVILQYACFGILRQTSFSWGRYSSRNESTPAAPTSRHPKRPIPYRARCWDELLSSN